MHPTTTLATAANPACSWTCQWKQGWNSVPSVSGSTAPTHSGDVKLILLVLVLAIALYVLGKLRRAAS
jgi:hypothetical protein